MIPKNRPFQDTLYQDTPSRDTVLVILDGFGISEKRKGNAVILADTPFLDSIYKTSYYSELEASGEYVGLSKNVMGNSEVGHLNIGAGRIVKQYSLMIDEDIKDNKFFENKEIDKAIHNVEVNKSNMHIMGLLSDGKVHSDISNFYAILKYLEQNGIDTVYVHIFSDGRDANYESVKRYIKKLELHSPKNYILSSIIGRYYAMDRDNRWDRTEKAFRLLRVHSGIEVSSINDAIEESYKEEISDEFIKPYYVRGTPEVRDNDSMIFLNFREDRARQISKLFIQDTKVYFLPMIQYDSYIKRYIYPSLKVKDSLSEVISLKNLKQLKIAETEKYAHVTYFLNGGYEKAFKGEDRILVPSLKVATYDLAPQMRTSMITDKLISSLEKTKYSFVAINFAAADMVGHTGNFKAVVKAIEIIDTNLKLIYDECVKKRNLNLIITADHGNAEEMIKDDEIYKEHTTNKVPFIFTNQSILQGKRISDGTLSDIAPTILYLLGLGKPKTMTGSNLLGKIHI